MAWVKALRFAARLRRTTATPVSSSVWTRIWEVSELEEVDMMMVVMMMAIVVVVVVVFCTWVWSGTRSCNGSLA